MDDESREDSPADAAVARRLRRLASMPVDTARLDARLRAALPPLVAGAPLASGAGLARRDKSRLPGALSIFFSPVRAVAASLLLAAAVAIVAVAVLAERPVAASPSTLAQIYQNAVDGRGAHVSPVTTIEEARAALQRKWPGTPEIPDVPEHQVMSCCVHKVGREQMACVTFTVDGTPVTLAIADERQIRMPHGRPQEIGGATYIVGSSDGVNMVMSRQAGKWRCIMGRLSLEQLADVARSLDGR